MANLQIKNPPEFTTEVQKVGAEDFITAELENEIKGKLLNNTVFLKAIADEVVKHMETSEIHVTTESKRYWDDKAETSTATQSENGLMSNIDKTKLDHIADKAEVNQNAISSVNAGGNIIEANGKTAQIAILSGSDNVTITGDNATKQVKIAVSGGNADTLGGRVASELSVNYASAANYANSANNANYASSCDDAAKLEGRTAAQVLLLGGKHLAGQGAGGGYSFAGDGAEDTGMFSDADGDLYFKQNGAKWYAAHSDHNHDSAYSKATNARNGEGSLSIAEGYKTIASGEGSHAEGFVTEASALHSHTEGYMTTASKWAAHAEGYMTTASGSFAHSSGYKTLASGGESAAFGKGTQATGWCSFAIGKYNIDPASANNSFNSPFIIGRGADDENRANAFRIYGTGQVYAQGAYNTGGADYAEFMEWLDSNSSHEDRTGYFVTLDKDKIKIANSDDYILGIISATASVIGNSYDDQWADMYLKDEWGRVIYEEVELPEELDEEGNIIIEARKEMQPKINPTYDNSKKYVGRSQREEWSTVGMLGQLLVRDDGTCKENGYCKCGDGGIATAAETGYRVLTRVSDNIIKILFR